ncbi:MAG TPA: hypothetical protein VK359_02345, partial [Rubrobacteraceae bacterium]|nr:hypothetical protein [Rubrobacteraceae bacterium]
RGPGCQTGGSGRSSLPAIGPYYATERVLESSFAPRERGLHRGCVLPGHAIWANDAVFWVGALAGVSTR